MVKVRTGYQTTDSAVFIRMPEKTSSWNSNNGLPTVVTSLLQMNMVGYRYVMPDIIGGNGRGEHAPSKELFIRWLQATVFMPVLQFSHAPWDYDQETIDISRRFVNLHAEHAEYIIKMFERKTKTGEPVNAPIWWLDPSDSVARTIDDGLYLGFRVTNR